MTHTQNNSSFFVLALALFFCLASGPSASAVTSPARNSNGIGQLSEYQCRNVFVLDLKGSVNPGSAELLKRAIKDASFDPPSCLLVVLDTPGGLVSSLREMVQAIMSSDVPVIVYVAPSGAQAASAGAILTMAAHVAAMAPGTNIGAAHPVGIGPGQGDETMAKKAENDLAAMARAIASERGRNSKWAEEAVRYSVSASAREALALKVIDMLAKNQTDLLERLNGREVNLPSGRVRLVVKRYQLIHIHDNLREKILRTIADPNIAYILLIIGIAGLFFEFAHPGVVLPGTVGALCLLLGLYAMQALPVTAVGLLLLFLAVILFVLELVITSYGLLGIAGFISLIIGSLMLYNTSATGVSLDATVFYSTVFILGIFFSITIFVATKAAISRPKSGAIALEGRKGIAKKRVGPKGGQVFVDGELWTAYSDNIIPEGSDIIVEKMEGLRLKVSQVHDNQNHRTGGKP